MMTFYVFNQSLTKTFLFSFAFFFGQAKQTLLPLA